MLQTDGPKVPAESKYNEFRAGWLYNTIHGPLGKALHTDAFRYFVDQFKEFPVEMQHQAEAEWKAKRKPSWNEESTIQE